MGEGDPIRKWLYSRAMSESTPEETITIQLDWSDEPPPVFANGSHVVATPREFALYFTEFAPMVGRGQVPRDQPPRAKVTGSLRMTPQAFFEMVTHCASSWNHFANATGDPGRPQPKFKLMGAGGLQLEGLAPPRSPTG